MTMISKKMLLMAMLCDNSNYYSNLVCILCILCTINIESFTDKLVVMTLDY